MLQYQVTVEPTTGAFYFVEQYGSVAIFNAHIAAPPFLDLMKARDRFTKWVPVPKTSIASQGIVELVEGVTGEAGRHPSRLRRARPRGCIRERPELTDLSFHRL